MSIWLVEGLPGSGKSTLAEHLCSLARESGCESTWYLEESGAHPVHSRSMKSRRRDGRFIEDCLQAWGRFAKQCQASDTIHILEGSAFQSTVRFMMEEKLAGIEDYYQCFEKVIASLHPRMVYLRPPDALEHSKYVSELRGRNWVTKVSAYVEKTPYAIHHGLFGIEGMHRFWADYAALCDEIVMRAKIPSKTITFVPGDWERHISGAAEFFGLKNRNAPISALRAG